MHDESGGRDVSWLVRPTVDKREDSVRIDASGRGGDSSAAAMDSSEEVPPVSLSSMTEDDPFLDSFSHTAGTGSVLSTEEVNHRRAYQNIPVSRIDDPDVVAQFRFRHYFSLSVIMFLAYLPPLFIIGTDIRLDLFIDHMWITAFLIVSVLIVFGIWWWDGFHRFSYTYQVAIMALTVLVLITCVCILSIRLDTLIFAKGALLSSLFIFGFGVYCLQSRCGLSRVGMLIMIVISVAGVSFVILYLPYRDMLDQHDIRAIREAPPSFQSTSFTLLTAFVILTLFVWRSRANEQKVCADDYLYATFLIFTDGFVLLALLVKDLCCSRMCTLSSGWKTAATQGPAVMGIVDHFQNKL